MKNTYKIILAISGIFFIFWFSHPARASVNLVKSKHSSTVYYLDGQRSRHAFPNIETYKSWYNEDFSKIVIVSDDFLSQIPLRKNMTVRPGKRLVKIPTDPKIYTVEDGGVLRHIENEGILEYFYGDDWKTRLVDIPEVFFSDYTLGEMIKNEESIPDNVIYKVARESRYYWKYDRVLWPLADKEAIFDNGYDMDDVIEGTRVYYSRTKAINGSNSKIFNPTAVRKERNADCESKKLKAAFVLVAREPYTLSEIEKLEKIKKEFSKYYPWSTREFSEIDTSYPTIIIKDSPDFKYPEGEDKLLINPAEVAQYFYEENPDVFDFIFVFSNFSVLQYKEQALFVPVTNRVMGTSKFFLEAGEMYGSRGKLKSMIIMDNIQKQDLETSAQKNHTMNVMMHEVLHNWSGEIAYLDNENKLNESLLKKSDGQHWNFYVDFVSPLGGAGWQDNGDGSFTSRTSQMEDSQKIQLPDIDLYLMGLIPHQLMKPIHAIIPDSTESFGNVIRGKKTMVTIQQIMDANGRWMCNL